MIDLQKKIKNRITLGLSPKHGEYTYGKSNVFFRPNIERTIKATEGLSRGKVIGIVCFPIDAADGWEGRMGVKKRITLNRELEIKSQLSCRFNNGIGIYMLDKSSDIDELVLSIIDFFQ